MFSRKRKSIICNDLCIFPNLETLTCLVETLNKENLDLDNRIWIFKWLNYFFYIIFMPVPGPAWLFWTGLGIPLLLLLLTVSAKQAPIPWSVTLVLNRNSLNILPLCQGSRKKLIFRTQNSSNQQYSDGARMLELFFKMQQKTANVTIGLCNMIYFKTKLL